MNIKEIEKKTGVTIDRTEVTHIIRTHQEGKRGLTNIITLEQSKDYSKWYIQTVTGDLIQLKEYEKLIKGGK